MEARPTFRLASGRYVGRMSIESRPIYMIRIIYSFGEFSMVASNLWTALPVELRNIPLLSSFIPPLNRFLN